MPTSIVTSAARPSAPSAAAAKLVAIEKKITVPPSSVARTAPCSQPGTSTQTTVTSAGAPSAVVTAVDSPTGSRASANATLVARPARSSASRSAATGTTPTVRPAPARRAAASDSDPLLPAPPITATFTGRGSPSRCRRATCSATTRAVSAGAPHTSSTARDSSGCRSAGSTAAIDRANRIAYPSQGTCSLRPSQRASPSRIVSGVSVSDTSVATRSPTVSPSGDRRPASSTVPISMPPDPVTGFCIFPRVEMISSTSARTFSPSPPCFSDSCRKLAASRFSRSTRMRTSFDAIRGSASSRQAACGSTPAGSTTRCRPTGDVTPTPLPKPPEALARTRVAGKLTAD